MLVGLLLMVALDACTGIVIHPANPRYFLFRGEPKLLITSAEHYGALLNLDFNYHEYFATLAKYNFTMTQIFSGSYVEPDSDCNADGKNPGGNTLSPANHSYIAPWLRTGEAGRASWPFGPKFDLTQYNETYFQRLAELVSVAAEHGVVVQVDLFCGYDTTHDFIWDVSPLNPLNNINGLANVTNKNVYTLEAGADMLSIHKEMTRKIVARLLPYDNVIYEVISIISEWALPVWGRHIVETIVEVDPTALVVLAKEWTEAIYYPRQTIANCGGGSNCTDAAGWFHPPFAVLPSILDSPKLLPKSMVAYRQQFWAWMLQGGGVLYNLDWSFTVGAEGGSHVDELTNTTSSGAEYRHMLAILQAFFKRMRFISLEPNDSWLRASGATHAYALAPRTADEPTSTLAAFIVAPSVQVRVNVGAYVQPGRLGSCQAEWIDTSTGAVQTHVFSAHLDTWTPLPPPTSYAGEDVALRVTC